VKDDLGKVGEEIDEETDKERATLNSQQISYISRFRIHGCLLHLIREI
jgi:hypothetical protein